MNLNIIVHKNEPQEPSVFTIEGKKEINTISIPVKYAEKSEKKENTILIPVKYSEKAERKEGNTTLIQVKHSEKKESDQISIPVKYAEKDNDYDEIITMLQTIKENQKMLQYIKSFIKAVIKRYR